MWMVAILGTMVGGNMIFAQQGSYWSRGTDPIGIFQSTAGDTNDTNIQDNRLNNVSRGEGWYPARYTISNTLDSLRVRIAPYLQWLVYIGLALAVIFIIYNGLLMVTWSLHSLWDWSSVQKRLLTLIIWVLILTGFYFIIQLLVIVVNSLAG